MSELIEVELPDGQVIWARVAENAGPRDVGLRNRVQKLKGLTEALQGVAHNLRDGLESIRPDDVTVSFGIEMVVGDDGLVAALAGASGAATLTVTLNWRNESTKRPG